MSSKKENIIGITIIATLIVITVVIFLWIATTKMRISQQEPLVNNKETYFLPQNTREHILSTPEETVPNNISATWELYTSDLGYAFEYPKKWTCKKIVSNETYSSVPKTTHYGDSCTSEETQKKFDEMATSEKLYYLVDDVQIRILYMTLETYLSDPTIQKTGDISLGEKNAHEVIIGGAGSNYGVVTNFDGNVLEIKFQAEYKTKIGANEQHILSTFTFTK